MSNPIPEQITTTTAESEVAATDNTPQQQSGAVLPPTEAAKIVEQNQQLQQQQEQPQPIQDVSTVSAPQPQKSQADTIDQTIRGLLIQIIALQHNKDASQQQA